MPTPSAAQRTLSARRDEFTNASVTPPAGHLTAPSLISLLDRVKALPITGDRRRVYEEYGVDRGMDEVRRWVNSPSVGRVDVVKVVDGEEVREMHVSGEWIIELHGRLTGPSIKAIWVDSSDSVPSLPPTRPMASPMPKS